MFKLVTSKSLLWLCAFAIACGIGISLVVGRNAPTQSTSQPSTVPLNQPIVSYRSPTCGCCGEWVKRMEAEGFTVEDNITENLEAIKKQHNLPPDLAACHTAIAAGYVIEGHVPASDIQKLLAEKNSAETAPVVGIAVPGMPIGSPGMESGNIREPYATYSFTQEGKISVFQEHPI